MNLSRCSLLEHWKDDKRKGCENGGAENITRIAACGE